MLLAEDILPLREAAEDGYAIDAAICIHTLDIASLAFAASWLMPTFTAPYLPYATVTMLPYYYAASACILPLIMITVIEPQY